MIDLPREPNPGENLDSSWGVRVVRALRALFPTGGPGIHVDTGPTGTTISAAAQPTAVRDKPPMPFDCRVSVVYPNGEEDEPETHLSCYVPQSEGWICQGCDGAVQPVVTTLAGQSISGEWLEVGEIDEGDSAWLVFTVSASNYAKYGHATPLYETPQAHVVIAAQGHSVPIPAGREDAYVLFPHVRIASLKTSLGLRQEFHGIYATEAAFGDDSLTGNGFGTTHGVRSLSVSNVDYEGYPGVVSLHGFRNPSTISNPYSDGGTAPASANDILVLVRVLSPDGKTAELKYLPLGLLVASDGGGGGYEPPEGLDDVIDDYNARVGIPCPSGHNNKQQLGYIWNPCDLYDKNGNKIAAAGWQVAMYWPIGGDHTTCRGSSIGDSSGNQVIDLNARVLNGDGNDGNGNNWQTNGHFSASGQVSAGADIVAHGSLVSFQSVILVDEQNNKIRSFLPTQITVGGQTMYVLAEAQP